MRARRVLLLGSSAVVALVLSLAGCSGESEPSESTSNYNNVYTEVTTTTTTTTQNSDCARWLSQLEVIDSQIDVIGENIVNMPTDNVEGYGAAVVSFQERRAAFNEVLGYYNNAGCLPTIEDNYVIPSPQGSPAAEPEPELVQAYECEMPALNYKPPVTKPDNNAGTRFSDGSVNCSCVDSVLSRLTELHTYYLDQQRLYGPGGSMQNNVLYGANIGFDASVQEYFGFYQYFASQNNCY